MFDFLVFTETDAKRVVDALFGVEIDIENMSWDDMIDWNKVLEEVQK
jgi:hypothetical protein